MKHIAFIPARAGSVGFPGKNRLFFDRTADFVKSSGLFDRAIVSTNDQEIKTKAAAFSFDVHHRDEQFSKGDVSIKQVAENLIEEMPIAPDDYLWLFYLTVLSRDLADFQAAKKHVEQAGSRSVCSFIEAQVHPYDCWLKDESANVLQQYIPNDVFRRQDKPVAWQHYHYVTCFQADYISHLNNELLCPDTYPIFLDNAKASQLVEIDTPEEYETWREKQHGNV